jgi:hypothetical protein
MSDLISEIVAIFDELSKDFSLNQSTAFFQALPFPTRQGDKIAIDSDGMPAFLISVQKTNVSIPSIILTNFSVQNNVGCTIIGKNGVVINEVFTTIQFFGSFALRQYFLRIVSAAILTLELNPLESTVIGTMQRLSELFHAINQQPQQSAQGLWAEIFIIYRSKDPIRLIQAWRDDPNSTFDFQELDKSIEVKSVTGLVRKHHFSQDQLTAQLDNNILIVSFRLVQSANGVSLSEMIEAIQSKISKNREVRVKFDLSIARTLGSSIGSAMDLRFEVTSAVRNCRVFFSETIPKLTNVPVEISHIRFLVDLTKLHSIAKYTSKP